MKQHQPNLSLLRLTYYFRVFCLTTLIAVGIASCDSKNNNDTVLPAHCIVVNQGNMSQQNGSLHLYNEEDKTIQRGLFEQNNNGRELAAMVESVAVLGQTAVVICNNPGKIEILNASTLAALTTPIEDASLVSNPRYVAFYQNKAYITCWGEPADKNAYPWTYPNSYILEVDLSTYKATKKNIQGEEYEGIYIIESTAYVATAKGIDVLQLPACNKLKTLTHPELATTAKHFEMDKQGRLWCSFASFSTLGLGFAIINIKNQTIEQALHTPGDKRLAQHGSFTTNLDGSQILYIQETTKLVESEWGNYHETVSTNVYTLSTSDFTFGSSPIIKGSSLGGIAVNPVSGRIYTANVRYDANNVLQVFDPTLYTEYDKQETGIATQGFVFY